MTMPTSGEARSRQTAYEAERHWWKSRLLVKADSLRARADLARESGYYANNDKSNALDDVADELDALIAERERP